MPLLPSGRFVALDPAPIDGLLERAGEPLMVHRIMAITDWHGLMAYIDVVMASPVEGAGEAPEAPRMVEGSPGFPRGTVPVSSGFRLDRLDELMREWGDEDKRVMREFVGARAAVHFAPYLDVLKERQSQLLGLASDPLARAMAHMHKLGVHWSQEPGGEEGEVEAGGDTYDALAALRACAEAVGDATHVSAGCRNALERAEAFLAVVCQKAPAVAMHGGGTLREVAAAWRRWSILPGVSPAFARWAAVQSVVECEALLEWHAELHALAPEAFATVRQAGISARAEKGRG